jgi:hypothetical protein
MSELAASQPAGMAYRPAWKPAEPRLPWRDCSRERREALYEAWSTGSLEYMLTPSQAKAHRKIERWFARKDRTRTYVTDTSRRWGKTFWKLVRAHAAAIRNPGWRIVYAFPEYKQARNVILPLHQHIIQDCPPGLHGDKQGPLWLKSEMTFEYSNGSRIELVGLDTNPDGARGSALDRFFGDEVAFFMNLEYLIQSIVKPQMMGRKHAILELASTPPVSPSHYWSSELVPRAIEEGAHDKRTIEEADQYSSEEVEEFVREAGGRRSTTCRREYFCEHVTDETMAVVPEFRDVEDEIVKAIDPPRWRDCYESMDPGWKDHTAVLFGYWHFEQNMLVVEDEISAPRLNSDDVSAAIKVKEASLWKGVNRVGPGGVMKPQPFLRVSDHDFELINTLSTVHGLTFIPTAKDDLDGNLNRLRVAISRKQIRIHPRCKRLIYDLKNAVWKNQAKKVFAHSSDLGHFDTVAALLYLWRSVQQRRNPAPKAAQHVAFTSQEVVHDARKRPEGHAKWKPHGQRGYWHSPKPYGRPRD